MLTGAGYSSQLARNTEVYTEEELKTSAAYNGLGIHHAASSVNVRLDGPNGSRIIWSVHDPVDGDGWSSTRLDSIRRLLPHIRQTVRVQQALAGAGALGASLGKLLDTTGPGAVQLDGRGRIVAANDRARNLLRTGDGLMDEGGFLYAGTPEGNAELQGLLTRALPRRVGADSSSAPPQFPEYGHRKISPMLGTRASARSSNLFACPSFQDGACVLGGSAAKLIVLLRSSSFASLAWREGAMLNDDPGRAMDGTGTLNPRARRVLGRSAARSGDDSRCLARSGRGVARARASRALRWRADLSPRSRG